MKTFNVFMFGVLYILLAHFHLNEAVKRGAQRKSPKPKLPTSTRKPFKRSSFKRDIRSPTNSPTINLINNPIPEPHDDFEVDHHPKIPTGDEPDMEEYGFGDETLIPNDADFDVHEIPMHLTDYCEKIEKNISPADPLYLKQTSILKQLQKLPGGVSLRFIIFLSKIFNEKLSKEQAKNPHKEFDFNDQGKITYDSIKPAIDKMFARYEARLSNYPSAIKELKQWKKKDPFGFMEKIGENDRTIGKLIYQKKMSNNLDLNGLKKKFAEFVLAISSDFYLPQFNDQATVPYITSKM